MAKLVFIVLALCLVQVSLARVTRDAPAPPAEENQFLKSLSEFGQKFQTALADTQQSVLKALGFQSNEEVVETIQKNTGKYVDQLKTIQATIQEEAAKHSNIFDPIVKDLNAQIAQTRQKLSEQNPELVQKAQVYQQTVQANIQSLATEAQKAGERIKEEGRGASEQLQAALKQLYDVTFQTLQKTTQELEPKKEGSR
ncbi:apolipophorin-III [Culex quinquefasciatus]|uniref:Apolipophorin-III n=1 Tax=Culex quinquefasciatus TaxID=7176 RepID=B0WKP4_CULQU|nr:apolipophorin-III [Culex quinquefasciatus]|eukprot:XP_001849278.1 apolipophorin-III [Culex quinquefasciatus]